MVITFEDTVTIARRTTEVFSELTDLSSWPHWASSVESFTMKTPGSLGVGSRLTHRSRRGRRLIETPFEVTALSAEKTFAIRSSNLRCVFTLVPDGSRTVLRTRFEVEASGWTALLYRLFLRRWAAGDLRRFKRFVESRPALGSAQGPKHV